METVEILVDAFGEGRVLGGLCKVFAQQTGPAEIEHIGLPPTIELGELDDRKSERVARILETLNRPEGMRTYNPDSILAAMWTKVMYV